MPWRELNRLQGWLMPPTMEELLPEDHPARVVAAFVDSLTPDDWYAMGVALEPRRMGVPAYHPRALLGVWIYGFMNGVRSTRERPHVRLATHSVLHLSQRITAATRVAQHRAAATQPAALRPRLG